MKRKTLFWLLLITLSGWYATGCSDDDAGTDAGKVSPFVMANIPVNCPFPVGATDAAVRQLDHRFAILQTEVPWSLWNEVFTWATNSARGDDRYYFKNSGLAGHAPGNTERHPVTTISWRDMIVWCNAATEWHNTHQGTAFTTAYRAADITIRNSLDTNIDQFSGLTAGTAATGFRLPSVQEWEMAARWRGTNTLNSVDTTVGAIDFANPTNGLYWTKGDAASGAPVAHDHVDSGLYAVYSANADSKTAEVGSKLPNQLGLYDMSGNVDEMCFEVKVRGGHWHNGGLQLQIGAEGTDWTADNPNNAIGLRPVRTVE